MLMGLGAMLGSWEWGSFGELPWESHGLVLLLGNKNSVHCLYFVAVCHIQQVPGEHVVCVGDTDEPYPHAHRS